MAHEIETMAFANEVPWHGLGNRVDPTVSVDDMLVAAGLNWEVQLRPLFAQATDGSMVKLPLRRALVRSSDNKIMTVTGDMWKPFQNRDALEFFREYTEAGGAKLETAGSLRGGKMVWALASIQEGFTVNRTDHSKGYILLTSPHEVGKSITVRTTVVRVVCANTMAMALRGSEADYSQNHLSRFNAAAAKETIGLAREQIVQAGLDAKVLNQLKMSEFDTVRFLSKFFQPMPETIVAQNDKNEWVNGLINDPGAMDKRLNEVLWSVKKAPGAVPATAWGVLNGVTHWADHVAGSKSETRLYNAWFGDKAKLKLQVRDELLQLAA
jgi:phage/plasmid-like protein (TIGR03299 family)